MFSRCFQDVCRIFPGCFLDATRGLRGPSDGVHVDSNRGSGSDATTPAYKARGARPPETVVPKPESTAQDHWWPIATHGWRRQVLVRLEVLHHDHSDNLDSHTSARYPPLGLIQIRPSACTVILMLILFQNIVEPTRIWNKALIKLLTPYNSYTLLVIHSISCVDSGSGSWAYPIYPIPL